MSIMILDGAYIFLVCSLCSCFCFCFLFVCLFFVCLVFLRGGGGGCWGFVVVIFLATLVDL